MILDNTANLCVSGGAPGSDLMWGMCAGHAGHTVLHFSFAGHRTEAPAEERVVIKQALLDEADPFLHRANQTLQRRFPTSSQRTNNLLRRNWYQVRDSGSLYGVSTFKSGQIKGGTAWAVAMFLDQHDGAACPAYLFDQVACRWYEWTGVWTPIYSPPKPQGVWAGIGCRDLDCNGTLAIRVLLDYQPKRRLFAV